MFPYGFAMTLAIVLTQCQCRTFIMNHTYLLRMIDELPTLCPHTQSCERLSPIRGHNTLDMAPIPGSPDWIVSCCSRCYCDNGCKNYRKCCPEALLQQYMDGAEVEEIHYECAMPFFKIPGTIEKPYVYDGFIMTDACLKYADSSNGWNETDKMKCEERQIRNIDETIPVKSKATKTYYANKYCAKCNNDDNNVTALVAYIGLSNRDDNIDKLKAYYNLHWKDIYKLSYEPNSDLNMYFISPNRFTDRVACVAPVITDCNITGLWNKYDPFYEFACKVYRSLFYQANEDHTVHLIFGNVFCAMCNGFLPDITDCAIPIAEMVEPGFLALINYEERAEFSPKQAGLGTNGAIGSCSGADFHDPLQDICRPWMCPKGNHYNGAACIASLAGFLAGNLLFTTKVGPIAEQPSVGDIEMIGQVLTSQVFRVNQQPYLRQLQASMYKEDVHNGPSFSYLIFVLTTEEIAKATTSALYVKAFLDTLLAPPTLSVAINGATMAVTVDHSFNINIESIQYNQVGISVDATLVNINNGETLRNMYTSQTNQVPRNKIVPVKKIDFCTAFILTGEEYVNYNNCRVSLRKTEATFYCTQYDPEVDHGIRLCVDDYLSAVTPHGNAAQCGPCYPLLVLAVTAVIGAMRFNKRSKVVCPTLEH